MNAAGAGTPCLEFLMEPAYLLRRHGDILNANAAGRRLLEGDPVGQNLFDHVESAHDELDDYLRRSGGSGAPIVGSMVLKTPKGAVRYRLHCAALADGEGGRALVLRCLSSANDNFSLLATRVRQLNQQLRTELHEKAVLHETLQHNQMLLRELQHRVKNNIQMITSLIQMSARQSDSAEFKTLGNTLQLRLQAMAEAQEALYRSKQVGTVTAGALLGGLVTSIGQSFGVSSKLRVEIADVELSHEITHSLALIVNELVVNAAKHGQSGCSGITRVTLGYIGEDIELVVHDNGPGFRSEGVSEASGLRLVRALCRQIGAAFEIGNENGARCSIQFRAKFTGMQA